MKQHITFKELDELSDKGKETLSDFLWQRMKDSERKVLTRNEVRLTDGVLLSIGQMIEFLEDEWFGRVDICRWEYDLEDERLWFQTLKGENIPFSGNLCDALWEAVKGVLNA